MKKSITLLSFMKILGTRAGSSYNNPWNASHTAMNANNSIVNDKFNDNHSCLSESEEKPTATSKPPPPIRRSSSISSQDANANVTNMYRKFFYFEISIKNQDLDAF